MPAARCAQPRGEAESPTCPPPSPRAADTRAADRRSEREQIHLMLGVEAPQESARSAPRSADPADHAVSSGAEMRPLALHPPQAATDLERKVGSSFAHASDGKAC